MPTNSEINSALKAVEQSIGYPRGTTLEHSFIVNQRSKLISWLMLRGISQKAANAAQVQSIALAYSNENYFQKWLQSDMKRGREVAGISWDATPPPPPPAATSSNSIGTASADDGSLHITTPPRGDDAITVTTAKIARAAEMVIGQRIDALRRDPNAGIDERVRNAKLTLSEDAKEQIRALARDTARIVLEELAPPRRIEVVAPSGNVVSMGLQHERFPTLLRAMNARGHKGQRLNLWLTGPTGSGKTTACENAAKALGLDFGFDSSLDTDYKVTGFTDAHGNVVSTQFIKCYTSASVYAADEIDNWLPSALIALNSALANGYMSTPAGIIRRHEDCVIVACANTWGLGATNDYVGRAKLDAASLDRFRPKIDWPYDERMEMAIARELGGEEWALCVQRTRHAAKAQGLQVIISPRATYDGIGLLAAGFSWQETVEMALTAGMKPEQVKALGITTPNAGAMPRKAHVE